MDIKLIKEKIDLAKKAVENQPEPYKTEAFKTILQNLLSAPQNKIGNDLPQDQISKVETKTHFSGVSKQLHLLMFQGFFDEPKQLKEVKSELEKNGFFYKGRLKPALLFFSLVEKSFTFIRS